MSKKIQYQIRVKGQLDERWTEWFGDMIIKSEGGFPTLSGTVYDKAALHDTLSRNRDLGLPLIFARRLDSAEKQQQQPKLGAGEK